MNQSQSYEGVDMIELVMSKQKLTSMDQLPTLVEFLRIAGDEASANIVENWFLSLEYHKMTEWDSKNTFVTNIDGEDPKTWKKDNHPVPYPDCVEKGCAMHPWVM